MRARPAAVAGRFYPAEPQRLAATVDQLVATAKPMTTGGAAVGVVAPHAGYRYSGPVAAAAYARLAATPSIRRVVVLGPAHFVPLAGCAVPAAQVFQTPLGPVPVDETCCQELVELAGVRVDDEPHRPEHSIEVQLPFLQRVLTGVWTVVPVVVGQADEEVVANLLDVAVGRDCVLVCSTDLSHYLSQEDATAGDRRTAAAITSRRPEAIGARDACGAAALRGALTWARSRQLTVELLDLRTSGDTVGNRARVVGYGAFALLAKGALL